MCVVTTLTGITTPPHGTSKCWHHPVTW